MVKQSRLTALRRIQAALEQIERLAESAAAHQENLVEQLRTRQVSLVEIESDLPSRHIQFSRHVAQNVRTCSKDILEADAKLDLLRNKAIEAKRRARSVATLFAALQEMDRKQAEKSEQEAILEAYHSRKNASLP